VAATFKNAPFLGQLLDILNHPIAAQRPDLHHFRPTGSDRHGDNGSPLGTALSVVTGSGGAGGTGAAVVISLLSMVVAMAAAVLAGSARARQELRRRVVAPMLARVVIPARLRVLLPGRRLLIAAWRLHPTVHRAGLLLHSLTTRVRPPRLRVRRHQALAQLAVRHHSPRGLALSSCVAALPALVVAIVLGAAGTRSQAVAVRPASTPAGSHLRSEVALDLAALPVGQPVTQPTWTHLVTIERGLVGQQDELAAQEQAIARLAINVGGQSPDEPDGVRVGNDSPPQLRNRLAMLVAAHTATQAAYQQSLQAEYDLYRAAAQDPAQRDQLIKAATAAAPQQPQVKEAVTYNLSLVQTQLAQEAQIAQAQARLQALGSLGQAQLDAMRHHQAFIAPEVAPVTQGFGPTDFSLEPPLTFNGTFYPHFHTGLDLGAPLDTPIHAAADGVVLLAAASVDQTGKLVGYGNYVVVAHPDGFVTLYGHLDSIAVKAGQVVHQGEIVGQEGSTGWSTGPHVHFEIRHDGQFLDPAPFLAGQLPPS
jgi:murein DD-endopeptidase MepM/ murein hydrolase activator NlpD